MVDPRQTGPDGPWKDRLRAAWRWLRPVVGVGLLVLLLAVVPLEEVLSSIAGARGGPLLLVILVSASLRLLVWLRLWLLVRTGAPGAGPFIVLRATYIGTFFNNFLPTGHGGDVLKVTEMYGESVPLGHAAASVVAERGLSMLVPLALAVVVAGAYGELFTRLGLEVLRWPMFAGAAVLLGGLALSYLLWRVRLKALLKSRRDGPILGRLYRAIESFYVFRNNPAVVVGVLALSVLIYLLIAANLVALVWAVGGSLPLGDSVAIIPIRKFGDALPISVGSLGVREGILTYCLSRLGLTASQGAAAALLLRALNLAHSAIGGCLYVWWKHGRKSPATQSATEEEERAPAPTQ
ncbi:MAG: lysylphosphatidylglycerol synthase transmembrane domain-containing protein [Candidatus Brocadiia bacterium]